MTSEIVENVKMSNIKEDIKEFWDMTIYFLRGFYDSCLDIYFTT